MDATEEEQIFAALYVEWKILKPDAVMDSRGIAQVGVAIGVTDCHVMDTILIGLEGWQNAFRREAVDRRHDWCRHQSREGERNEVGLVMDEVELARATWSISQTLASMVGSSE